MRSSAPYYEKASEVASGLRVERWLRAPAFASLLSKRMRPRLGVEYVQQVASMGEVERQNYRATLIDAREHASYQCDAFGVAGIPIFIGLVMLASAFGVSVTALSLYAGIIIVYLVLYLYYRNLKAMIVSLLEIAGLH